VVLRAPSTHEAVEALTDRVCEALSQLPMQERKRFELKFVVHEALTNAAEHGNKGNPTKQVTITCRHQPHQVTLIVDDEGEGFDAADVPNPTAQENLLRETGRGVFLMRHYADECRFEDRGRRVVIVKRLC
jgi:serine/threonine-protein kinase RsbW